MDLELSHEHALLRDSVRRALAEAEPEAAWRRCVDLGLAGLDCRDGVAAADDAIAMTIVQEELGRALVAVPFVTTVVQAASIMRETRPDMLRAIEGGAIVATADDAGGARYGRPETPVRALPCHDGWRLDGRHALVPFADRAHHLVVPAHTADDDGITLFLLPASVAGLALTPAARHDAHPAADLNLDGVVVGDDARLGPVGGCAPRLAGARRMAVVALVAEAVGCMDALLALTLDYLRTRQQFGRPLARFQALQHRAADMYVAVEQARSMMLFAALTACDPDADARARAAAAAKVQAGRSARFVGQQAIQLHGGIGLADEHRAGHYFKRLTAIEVACGDADHHLACLAERGGLFAAGELATG